MMFNEPGEGHHVLGEIYQVNVAQLARLDQIESVGKPGNYRVTIDLYATSGGERISAFVYMKSRDLAQNIYHSGNLESYQDDRFIPIEAR
jgi:gamma-glutamylaminecyclotransferase